MRNKGIAAARSDLSALICAICRHYARRAGIDKHFHDLRGTAATEFYLAGFTLPEIAVMLAWEEEGVGRIIDRYVNRETILKDKIRRLDQNVNRTKSVKQGVKPATRK